MTHTPRAWRVTVLMAGLLCAGATAAPPPAAAPVVSLRDASSNTWARVAYSETGWREQPIFVYAPGIGRFVMAAGIQATGGVVPRHYDTEEFHLAAARWANAYPPGSDAGRAESGPVGEAYAKAREKLGYNGFEMFYKDGEFLRVAAGGQWTESKAGYEFCYVPDHGAGAGGKVYAYIHDHTLRYDPAKRTWADLAAKPRTSCRIWGAMAYDPVNKEILHAGGDGGEDEVGTWVYSIEKNEWTKLEFGSAEMRKLNASAKDLRWRAKSLLGAACNRFALTETADEAKADLTAQALGLAKAAEELAAAARAGSSRPVERRALKVGAARLDEVAWRLKAHSGDLKQAPTPAVIAKVRELRADLEQVVDALSPEPPGRARSQMAFDASAESMVLFGGDRLDRVLSDTWTYDCLNRNWTQHFPAVCPAPRAGHVLAALPKAAGTVVLAGGYSRVPLAQEVWTYDLAKDTWQMLAYAPVGKADADGRRSSAGAPRTDARRTQVGAVDDDDVLVCPTAEGKGLATWAMKVDPAKPIEIPEGQAGTSGAYTFNAIAPQTWEAVANPDAARMTKAYDAMPANQWTAVPFAKYAPGAQNRWGTTAYDTDRHQFLFWGGGHATSHENDVAHFSVRGGCWTIGYHPDDPIETVYASQPTPVSFADRPHVPVHAYKTYCYDPAAGRMMYLDRAYDPAAREWEAKPYLGLESAGVMNTQLKPTPLGAVAFSKKGLFRLDAKSKTWSKLPWTGPRPESIWCDGEGLVYDSKRDCLWFGMKKEIYRYDLKSGKAEKLPAPTRVKSMGEYTFWGEQVYLPEADLILIMNLFKRPDGKWGNVAYDPATGKFLWLDLKWVEEGKPAKLKGQEDDAKPFSWSDALMYDPELRLVLLNNSASKRVWALRLDRGSLNTMEMGD